MKLAIYLALLALTGGAQTRRSGEEPAASSFVRQVLAAHNEVRARVGVGPLEWSAKLAAHAQEWADTLAARNQFVHRPNSRYGQNLLWSSRRESAGAVVGLWAAEARDYDYQSNRCRGVCGHYTQVVWSATREVGCAVAYGRGREVWVCDYDPPGNFNGRRPY